MAHPFAKMFETALNKSSLIDNCVIDEAQKLIDRGYARSEVCNVLTALYHGRIDSTQSLILKDACEEICGDDAEG
jgi:hypothetical protein